MDICNPYILFNFINNLEDLRIKINILKASLFKYFSNKVIKGKKNLKI